MYLRASLWTGSLPRRSRKGKIISKDNILASLGKCSGGVLKMEKSEIIYVHAYLLFLIMKMDVSHWKKKKKKGNLKLLARILPLKISWWLSLNTVAL